MRAPGSPDSNAQGRAGGDRQRQLMAYSHSMSLISQPETVMAHFRRARDRCLNDVPLDCILLAGTANAGNANARMPPSAELAVSLPHDQGAVFKKGLLSALPGREPDISVRSEHIEADNVTQQVMDIDQHSKQLTGYRDRLTAIVEQPGIKASELIELESKIAEVQSQLDQLATQKTAIMDRVKRERVSVRFSAETSVSDAGRPLAEAWDSSFEILGRSASALLTLIVVVLPWLPVVALIWFIAWLVRRRKRHHATVTPVSATNAETLKPPG
jgi:hypothetical protein